MASLLSVSSVGISTTNPSSGPSLGTRLCASSSLNVRKGKHECHPWEEIARPAEETAKPGEKGGSNRSEVES